MNRVKLGGAGHRFLWPASRCLAIAGIALLSTVCSDAADTRRLTLPEAVHLAISQNRVLTIARLKVVENQQKKAGERSAYFPSITNQSNLLHISELQNIGIRAGAFGTAAGSLVPSQGVILPQGQKTLVSSGTMIAQPLTQLIRIHESNKIAAAEVAVSRDDLKKAENQVALQVHTLYYGILIARLQKQAAEQQSTYAGEQLRESEDDIRNGSALRIAAIQGRAGVLESQQSVLTADLQLADLTTELNDLLGLPLDTRLDLDPAVPASFEERPREEYVQTAWSENPEIMAAEEVVRKAHAGVAAAKSAYIPDVTAYARHSYQNGVPFLVRNFGTFGVNLSWDVFDFGKRQAAVREREAQLAQAEENLRHLKEEVAVGIERSYNKLERTKSMVQVAKQVVRLRQEGERLAQNQLAAGVMLVAERRQATAATYKAEADSLQTSLGYLLAWAELEQAVGRTPGF
ncbi:MAG TPA: TolC family protein [Candidatus Acidoferrales bacterium]|jgi:outer membrane protein TolC|nr:TolC family protein [Candidatus Acidoferrales bacterium]